MPGGNKQSEGRITSDAKNPHKASPNISWEWFDRQNEVVYILV